MLPALLLIATMAETAGAWGWLEAPLFAPPLAQPRAPELGLGWHLDGPRYVDGVVGGRFGLVRRSFADELELQLGLEGAGWVRLHVEANTVFALRTADYLIGLPVMARWRTFEAVLELTHVSAHLGDGFAYEGEILVDRLRRVPLNYSREWLALRVAWRSRMAAWHWRLYGGGGALVHVRPQGTRPAFLGGGGELVLDLWWTLAPYLAVDLSWNQDAASLDLSGQLGCYLGDWSLPRTLRLALAAYHGSDRRGQALGQRAEFLSLLLLARL